MDQTGNLYQINLLKSGPEFSCQLEFDKNHPVLKGHFPGNPVVPGAWLIRAIHDTMELLTGRRLSMVHASQVKFLQPVLPESTSVVNVEGKYSVAEGNILDVVAQIKDRDIVITKFRGTFAPV
jgi:3-hydroxyacyl-[acyl-carrier-protein] dehydratase